VVVNGDADGQGSVLSVDWLIGRCRLNADWLIGRCRLNADWLIGRGGFRVDWLIGRGRLVVVGAKTALEMLFHTLTRHHCGETAVLQGLVVMTRSGCRGNAGDHRGPHLYVADGGAGDSGPVPGRV